MNDNTVVITGAARTAMGGMNGALAGVSAVQLGTEAIRAAIARSGFGPGDIDEVIMGCVLPAGLRQGPARQAALGAGVPTSVGCTTVNKLCGSGMQAVIFAHDQLRAGTCSVMVAGGMESMSNAPHMLLGARQGIRLGHAELKDHMFHDGLEDAYTGRAMVRTGNSERTWTYARGDGRLRGTLADPRTQRDRVRCLRSRDLPGDGQGSQG